MAVSKPKIAFYWCSSCGGCEESIIDLAQDLIDINQNVDIIFWPIGMDAKHSDIKRLKSSEIKATLINGAVRMSEQEDMANLLRQKSEWIIAHGACAHMGGVVGLANFYSRPGILQTTYDHDTVQIFDGQVDPTSNTDPHRAMSLSEFYPQVKSLDQVIEVDYYIPGCPPTPDLVRNVLKHIISGTLPAVGSVLSPNLSLCESCPRKATRPVKVAITRFKRLYEIHVDPDICFLNQHLICLGPATRGGCDARCISANMPCRGCFGPLDNVRDFGTKALAMLSALIDTTDENRLNQIIDTIPDPAGLMYRYSLAASILGQHIRRKND